MLQLQRRQQTVREIRQRQAAAAEAAGRAAPSSAVQSEAENESAKRAAPGQRQDNAESSTWASSQFRQGQG